MSNKMKDKIEKLLAKAESTSNDHERDAFTAKAQRLMLEWGIEEAELESRGEVRPEPVVEIHRSWHTTYAIAWVRIAADVAYGMGGLRVLKSGSKSHHSAYAIGHQTDVENFWILMNSIELQATVAMKRWWRISEDRPRAWTARDAYKMRREFLLGFGAECGRRLRDLRKEVHVDATPGAALVLVSKDQRVSNYIDNHYRLRKVPGMTRDTSGEAAGREAGRRADLGGKSVESNGATAIGGQP